MKGYTNYNKTLTLDLRYGKLYLFYVPQRMRERVKGEGKLYSQTEP